MVTPTPFAPADIEAFAYRGYTYDPRLARFVGTYELRGSQSVTLEEVIDLPEAARGGPVPEALLRLLHLACGLSYYKAAAPERVEVDAGLTAAERGFLAALFLGGLGEFAYRNDLAGALRPDIVADVLPDADATPEQWHGGRPLVAVGGGKDSVVSIEATARAGMDPVLFSVNQYAVIDACVAASGRDIVRARRQLDPQLRALNEAGAHNGHVPVTAINSLIALATAAALDLGPVVMSNEESANHGNLRFSGVEVNHQWSKTLEFEALLRGTLAAAGLAPDRYFSLLRPFTELEIAAAFAQLPAYFGAITSCNRAFTLDPATRASAWCGECSKCRFVYLMLATAMSRADLDAMFGRNPLDEDEALAEYREIVGLSGHKPFECVGDVAEAEQAVRTLAADPAWAGAATLEALAAELPPEPTPLAIAADRTPLWAHVPDAYRAALRELFDV